LISALFIFNITFLSSQQKEKKEKEKRGGRLLISGKEKGGRATSKNKTSTGAGSTFSETT
jgi:hypothetical protein